MDSHCFDALTNQLYALINRREGLRVFIAGVVASGLGFAGAGDAAACKRRGDLCTKDAQCCSKGCANLRKRKLKDKKGKRHEKLVGKCSCSRRRQSCKIAPDCCDQRDACGGNNCDNGSVCCTASGFPCEDDCDCCGGSICGDSGTCEPSFCSRTQEPCDTSADCCFADETCGSLDPACESEDDPVCCGGNGSSCEEFCDCCVGFRCDDAAGECVEDCSDSGAICATLGSSDVCCNPGDICLTVACNGSSAARCCRTLGPPCVDDCDCCGTLACISGACSPA